MKQNKAKVIGLTGGIATGKSTVSNILKEKGFKIIDADKIAREIVEVGSPAYKKILDYFGESILNNDETINRVYLGQKIFNSQTLRAKVNDITHPYIIEKISKEIGLYSSEDIIFLDVPLLLETIDKFEAKGICIDKLWIVYCDEKTEIERLMIRNNLSYEEAVKRVSAQMSIEEKKELADTIIDNTKDMETLIENIEKALKEIS
ncbi:dephospho-CoA kinase CoaE [Gottschalkia acidurici 9a]|uniref:Dephospho-CoA kinase n=1 Tax=Gottschalkia acidurici (strain ATCC 7906 / DSM 604 / BCRC 14475 / CIP 104303 / KCTC 5404 / NCIMB 10678 / 9a) TaxID=1128398 RepID=K0AZ81_GOTA9|nr:dephospho-CoA kinase [Gottschalkia acidurici]AFS78005.1 dephospho-CoA kinase CoaE [Gottschalkia acidurici 9a]